MSKAKGSRAERDLMKIFWENGWACVRAAGSGSTSFPAPDLIAGNKVRRVAVECKITKSSSKYFSKDEIKQLKGFSDYFGAEPWVAVKLDSLSWHFLNVEDLKETKSSYAATKRVCEIKGLRVDEFFSGFD